MDKQFYIKISDYKKILDTISILQLEVVKLKNQIEVLKRVREIEQKIIEKNEIVLNEIIKKVESLLKVFSLSEQREEIEKIKEEVESIVSTLREIKESLETKV